MNRRVAACLMVWVVLASHLSARDSGHKPMPALRQWGCHQEKDARREFRMEFPAPDGGPGVLHVTVTAAQAANHVQLTAPFSADSLERFALYRVRFRAKAVPQRRVSVHVLGNERPWTNCGLRSRLDLGPDWREYAFAFRYYRPDQEKVKVDFFLGDVQGDVWITDVALEALSAGSLPAPAGPVVRTAETRVAFGEAGAVRSVCRVGDPLDLAAGAEVPPGFVLTCRMPDGVEVKRESTEANTKRVEVEKQQRAFVYEYEDMSVRTAVRKAGAAGGILFEFALDNRGPAAVTAVQYPILSCPAKLGADSADDRILYPRCDGGLVEDPLRTMGKPLSGTYPGPLSCQVMAYYDDRSGCLLATLDPDGYPKRFAAELGVDLRLSVTHLLPAVFGRGWALSYPTLLMAFKGDWHQAADRYRKWAHCQSWCARLLSKRPDLPQWLRKGAVVTYYNPRAKTPSGKVRFSDEGLEAYLQEVHDKTGLAVVPNNRGWEHYGAWCGQEYLPPYPDEATFRRQATIIRRHGAGMVMLSGFRWTIDKHLPDGEVHSNQERFDAEVKQYVTHSLDGEPRISVSKDPTNWRGSKYARLCPATDFARDTVANIARHCVEAGYPVIHFDQEVSGCAGSSFCGSREHGHAPGYGRWIHQALADTYMSIREQCVPLDQDFVLSMEEPNELYIPWLNLIQSRPNGIALGFPMSPPFRRVIPLFSYLYHDYVVGWLAFYPWRSAGHHCETLAKGFAAGMMPGVADLNGTRPWKPHVRERYFTMLRNCCELYAGEAHDFLLFGRMQPPLDTDIAPRTLRWGKQQEHSLVVPTVFHSVWSLADGRRAATFFNPTPDPVTVHIVGEGKPDAPVVVPALSGSVAPL